MESYNISNWTKEQLKKEVMKLRDQTKTPKKDIEHKWDEFNFNI